MEKPGLRSDVWISSSFCGNAACVEVMRCGDEIQLRVTGDDRHLTFTTAEWQAFVAGAKAGQFDL